MTTLALRQTVVLVALFVATSLAFVLLDNRGVLNPLVTGLRSSVEPVAGRLADLGDGRDDESSLMAQIKAEKDALAAENARLRLENQEVQQLREQLKVQTAHPEWAILTARVISSDPTNLQKFITIDKGSADGIELGMAVLDSNYYVGQVTKVEEHSARVTLIIDSTAAVGAQILDTGAAGVVQGTWQQGGRAELQRVERDNAPKEGQLVVTAAVSSVAHTEKVPPGVIIGKVSGPSVVDNQADTVIARILPVANLDGLRMVAVIIGFESAQP